MLRLKKSLPTPGVKFFHYKTDFERRNGSAASWAVPRSLSTMNITTEIVKRKGCSNSKACLT